MKPAPLRVAVPIFAATSMLFFLSLYVGLPLLRRSGTSWFATFNVVLVLPMFLLAGAALIAYRWEGQPYTWPGVRERFRLLPVNLEACFWTVALSIFMYGGRYAILIAFAFAFPALVIENRTRPTRMWRATAAVALFLGVSWLLWRTAPWLAPVPLHGLPADLHDFLNEFGAHTFMGIPLSGNWWIAFYYSIVLIAGNIGGEELWWRGYLLPRQELAHGSIAWLVHGVLWAAFHVFFQVTLWDMVRMMPTCCALAFVAQHKRNIWPGIVGHTIGNSGLLLQIVRGI